MIPGPGRPGPRQSAPAGGSRSSSQPGSGGGTFIGGWINKTLDNKDPLIAEAFVSSVYAVLLGFLGFYEPAD